MGLYEKKTVWSVKCLVLSQWLRRWVFSNNYRLYWCFQQLECVTTFKISPTFFHIDRTSTESGALICWIVEWYQTPKFFYSYRPSPMSAICCSNKYMVEFKVCIVSFKLNMWSGGYPVLKTGKNAGSYKFQCGCCSRRYIFLNVDFFFIKFKSVISESCLISICLRMLELGRTVDHFHSYLLYQLTVFTTEGWR